MSVNACIGVAYGQGDEEASRTGAVRSCSGRATCGRFGHGGDFGAVLGGEPLEQRQRSSWGNNFSGWGASETLGIGGFAGWHGAVSLAPNAAKLGLWMSPPPINVTRTAPARLG